MSIVSPYANVDINNSSFVSLPTSSNTSPSQPNKADELLFSPSSSSTSSFSSNYSKSQKSRAVKPIQSPTYPSTKIGAPAGKTQLNSSNITQQNSLLVLQQTNQGLPHPGAPPSAPPLTNITPVSTKPFTDLEAHTSSLSSSSVSSTSSSEYTAKLKPVEPSSIIDTATASIIGGLNPIWSFDKESNKLGYSLSSLISPASSSEPIKSREFIPFKNSSTTPPLQQSTAVQATSISKPVNILNDESILSMSTRDVSVTEQPIQPTNNKPIGYERHEKQIHNNSQVNQNSNQIQNNNMNPLLANNLNMDELNFSCNIFVYNKNYLFYFLFYFISIFPKKNCLKDDYLSPMIMLFKKYWICVGF